MSSSLCSSTILSFISLSPDSLYILSTFIQRRIMSPLFAFCNAETWEWCLFKMTVICHLNMFVIRQWECGMQPCNSNYMGNAYIIWPAYTLFFYLQYKATLFIKPVYLLLSPFSISAYIIWPAYALFFYPHVNDSTSGQ